MPRLTRKSPASADRYTSAWSLREVLWINAWKAAWLILFRPTPKRFNRWRLFLLRLFGATIHGRPFVYPSAKVYAPFLLTLEHHACLGPYSEVYNLGPVCIKRQATLSQQAYICNGTHDFDDPAQPLLVGEITVGEDVFIGARAFILPGINVGDYAIVAACAVVTKDVASGDVVAGNPARVVRTRQKGPSGAAPNHRANARHDGDFQ